jgi:branched-chain amino acid transport system ATP-binding protein
MCDVVTTANGEGGHGGRTGTSLLEMNNVYGGYGVVPVLRDVSLNVRAGEVVSILGRNGAGKSTVLRTVIGLVRASGGHIKWEGRELAGGVVQRTRLGISYNPEQRSIFMGLTVAQNLQVARRNLDKCFSLFPELTALVSRKAGLLSGGEQQMLVLARALTSGAKLVMVDELSLGLGPLVVQRLLEALRAAASSGVAVLLVEQQVAHALQVADWVYVLDRGSVVMSGSQAELIERQVEIANLYLGGSAMTSSRLAESDRLILFALVRSMEVHSDE